MRIPFLRYPFKHPGPQNAPSGTSGPYTVTFLPSAITDGMDGLVAHIGEINFTVVGTITLPAGGLVGPDDWDLMLAVNTGTGAVEGTGINMSARGEIPVQCSYQSARRIIMSEAELAGISADLSQTGPLCDNSQGQQPTDFTVTVVYTIRFHDDRWIDYFKYVKSLQWWSQGNWTFNLADPSAVFGNGYVWKTTAPTVQLGITLLMSPHIIDCAPFEWREKITQSQTGATTQWEPGIYDVAGFYSPCFQGAGGWATDDLIATLATIQNSNYPYRFPVNVSPFQWALLNASAGAPAGSPFALNLSNPVLSTLRLFGPDWAGHRASDVTENQLVQAKQINWTTTMVGGQSFTTQQQYYMARAKARSLCSPNQPAGSTGALLIPEVVQTLKSGCANGFANWIPLAPPGHATPPPVMYPRTTMVARRK